MGQRGPRQGLRAYDWTRAGRTIHQEVNATGNNNLTVFGVLFNHATDEDANPECVRARLPRRQCRCARERGHSTPLSASLAHPPMHYFSLLSCTFPLFLGS